MSRGFSLARGSEPVGTTSVVMSSERLQESGHVFVISRNTWHQRGDPGKESRGDGAHASWVGVGGRGRRIDDKTDPIFINATLDCRLIPSFPVPGQGLLRRDIFLILRFPFFALSSCQPPLFPHARERLKEIGFEGGRKWLSGIGGRRGAVPRLPL